MTLNIQRLLFVLFWTEFFSIGIEQLLKETVINTNFIHGYIHYCPIPPDLSSQLLHISLEESLQIPQEGMVALTILVYRYFLDNPFGSLLSFWLTVVADLQQLLYLVSNYLTCIVFFSAFWKWFSVNAFPWSCIARRRVGKYCSKQDP